MSLINFNCRNVLHSALFLLCIFDGLQQIWITFQSSLFNVVSVYLKFFVALSNAHKFLNTHHVHSLHWPFPYPARKPRVKPPTRHFLCMLILNPVRKSVWNSFHPLVICNMYTPGRTVWTQKALKVTMYDSLSHEEVFLFLLLLNEIFRDLKENSLFSTVL